MIPVTERIADISGYQGTNLSGLPGAGIFGVILKFTEGTGHGGGHRARAQALSAAQHGIMVLGAYDFARPGSGAAEANVLADAVQGVPVHVLVIDAEVPGITANHVVEFAQTVAARGYGRALLYGSTSYIRANYGGNMAVKQWCDLWVAEYHRCYCADHPPPVPDPFNDYVGWQFTSREPVAGLGAVDCSVFNRDYLGGAYHHSTTNPANQVDNRKGDDMIAATTDGQFYRIVPTAKKVASKLSGGGSQYLQLAAAGTPHMDNVSPLVVVREVIELLKARTGVAPTQSEIEEAIEH